MKKIVAVILLILAQSSWAGQVKFEDIVIREMLPGMQMTSGYFNLTNHTDKTIKLNSVSSPLFGRIEIHQHVMENGMMDMREVTTGVTIEPKQTLEFKPGGYHLMLFKPKQKIAKKSQVELQFNFAKHKQVVTGATVMSVIEQQKLRDKAHHH